MELKTVCFKGNEDKLFKMAGKIREDIFLLEQGFSVEYDDIDKEAYHVIVFDGEKPIATSRFYGADNPVHIGRVAVIKEYRNKGIGVYLMKQTETFAKEKGALSVTLGAQIRASTFYRKCGYKEYGEEYMDEFCPHINMLKTL
ncbi:MAG: GNAT family N-acetyltransferase [Ruminococcaceae bacterium]|nr:GNAT family N-acetyltransferase [Oscillospiraceae bacterium]